VGWYWKSERSAHEALELRERFPTLELKLDFAKREAEVTGVLPLTDEVGYQVRILIPPGYPEEVPALLCSPNEVPRKDYRHNSGEYACLCARCDYRKYWPRGSTLPNFIESLVVPFLTCQHYYDIHGHWPQSGEREHGAPGIVQAYNDFCRPLGEVTGAMIGRVVRILAVSGLPKGHNPCPCGSGKRIRDCHRSEIEQMRSMISPRDAAQDLADLLGRQT
jgi:hypothetical protein